MASQSGNRSIYLPEPHRGQLAIHRHPARFKSVCCGRRWGKTHYLTSVAVDGAVRGQFMGYFAPEYKFMAEAYEQALEIVAPLKKQSSKTEGVIRLKTGGRIDFWSLENEAAGRGRKYHGALIDEAAFTKNSTMSAIWQRAIKPTLLDYRGYAIAASTPNGIDPDNWFYQINTDASQGFVKYHAPSHTNPHLPREELDLLEEQNHPMVFKQEYLAEFIDWSGVAFFSLEYLLDSNRPVPYPNWCDSVFAVIDSAVKSGSEHDGTAVVYCAYSKHVGIPLTILDWDITQMEGAVLEEWLPSVRDKLEEFARLVGARLGVSGIHIEDKASGTILLQQAMRRELPVHAIDSKLTQFGKDERAVSVSGYVYRNLVKLSENAYNKTSVYKGSSRNHLVAQLVQFRPGDKEHSRRADDLLDCFTYSVAISLGNHGGY
jgi:hypothetical protein